MQFSILKPCFRHANDHYLVFIEFSNNHSQPIAHLISK